MPFVLGVADVANVRQFCTENVEAVGVEADQIQAQALSRYLGVRTRVAYLDANAAVDEVEFIEMTADESSPILLELLFRPGHYDILFQ